MAGKKKTAAQPLAAGTVAAAEFKATCLELMDRVRETGIEYVVTKHGKPVAKLVPISVHDEPRAAAKRVLLERLRTQAATPPIGRWTRDDLYGE